MKSISVNLCGDHFERLRMGSVCDTCPSNALNEKKVKALSKIIDSEEGNGVVAMELMSIRENQRDHGKKLEDLDVAVRGDGKSEPGIMGQLSMIKSTATALKWAFGIFITIFLALLAIHFGK